MKILSLLLLLNCFFSLKAQITCIDAKDSTLIKICHSKFLTTGDPGEGDYQNIGKCLNLLNEVKYNYSTNEILKLSKHTNPKVRAYAFWALALKKHPKIKSIIYKNIKDTSSVFLVDFGCFAFEMSPFDYMLNIVTKCEYFFEDTYKLSKEEILGFIKKRKTICFSCQHLGGHETWSEYIKYVTNCY
jgi:hypothetical protein